MIPFTVSVGRYGRAPGRFGLSQADLGDRSFLRYDLAAGITVPVSDDTSRLQQTAERGGGATALISMTVGLFLAV